VRGELEIATAPDLTAALDEAIRTTSGPFVIDLTNVGFLDSSGITCLMRARALLGREDRTLGLICPPSSTRRVLDLVGMDELVALYTSREEVLRALARSAEGG
jgi:anti-sigma B factor antagonist